MALIVNNRTMQPYDVVNFNGTSVCNVWACDRQKGTCCRVWSKWPECLNVEFYGDARPRFCMRSEYEASYASYIFMSSWNGNGSVAFVPYCFYNLLSEQMCWNGGLGMDVWSCAIPGCYATIVEDNCAGTDWDAGCYCLRNIVITYRQGTGDITNHHRANFIYTDTLRGIDTCYIDGGNTLYICRNYPDDYCTGYYSWTNNITWGVSLDAARLIPDDPEEPQGSCHLGTWRSYNCTTIQDALPFGFMTNHNFTSDHMCTKYFYEYLNRPHITNVSLTNFAASNMGLHWWVHVCSTTSNCIDYFNKIYARDYSNDTWGCFGHVENIVLYR